ncbi:MAG: FHA domain-containing protein [Gammaproteobacteria bacterium]|nr:FHA domain-containing protein [Gammaproteobacteria bacterium]
MAILIQMQEGESGVKVRINKQRFCIGRGTENDLCLNDELVSKQHAIIELVVKEAAKKTEPPLSEFFIHDQGSTNHTYVNDKAVGMCKLKHNDIIRIGMNNFQFQHDASDTLQETTQLRKTWLPGVFLTKKKGDKK